MSLKIILNIPLFLLIACCTEDTSQPNRDRARPEKHTRPVIFLYDQAGMYLSGHEPCAGLVAAIWSNGIIVRRNSRDDCKNYERGILRDEDVSRLIKVIGEADGYCINGSVPVDGACVILGYITKGGVRMWIHTPHDAPLHIMNDIEQLVFQMRLTNRTSEAPGSYRALPQAWLE